MSDLPLLSAGYRPFFLCGALWYGMAALIWLPGIMHLVPLPQGTGIVTWHAHEMLFGAAVAIVAGFMLTAIPNWTGRLPIRGAPLAALVLVWQAGRVAMTTTLPFPGLAAAVDCLFLLALVVVAGREIVAGRNWRNLKIVLPLGVLFASNVLFHAAEGDGETRSLALRLALGSLLVLVMLIGGRIVPSFTRNWLAKRGSPVLPVPFGAYDKVALLLSSVALTGWVVWPLWPGNALFLPVAAALNAYRLWRWAGLRTMAEPLVTMLHAAFLFVPVGMALAGLAAAWPGTFSPTAALHAWGAGAIGTMTLAVMMRASRGHGGRTLSAGSVEIALFLLIALAAFGRIATALDMGAGGMLHLSVAAWVVGWFGFAVFYAPILMGPRVA